jgi:Transcriptional regulators
MDLGVEAGEKAYWTEVAVAFQRAIRSFDEFVKPILVRFDIAQLGLTNILFLISVGDQPKRVADLVRQQRYAGSNASYALSALIAAGLVERRCDENDKRVRVVSLTPLGRAVLDEIRSVSEGNGRQICAALETIDAFETHVTAAREG